MRKLIENQFEDQVTASFVVFPIEKVKFDVRCRDEITKTLRGLQAIYMNKECRQKIFVILETMIPKETSKETGRKGMPFWTIFVLGMLRLSCNWNYDRLKNNYDNHQLIRQMCGIDLFCDSGKVTSLQTIHDNISLFTDEIADEISSVVVEYGHKILKKKS
jgi:hypothetical protein